MATTKQRLTVDELTKYGFKANNEYVNWSKNCTDQGKAVPGGTYEFEVFTAESGKKYVNKVLAQTSVAAAAPAPAVKKEVTVKHEVTPKAKEGEMTRADWEAKDRRISRQGCIQVAVQVCAEWEGAIALADKMLGYVNG